MKNGGETDIDCGGPDCGRCAVGKACKAALDCLSESCDPGGHCAASAASACTNGAKDGDETDVDCGGSCPLPCADGKACKLAADCTSLVCTANSCVAANCMDKVRNGSETDVDCGGACTTKCPDRGICRQHRDCQSGVCTGIVCQAPTCVDSVRNGTESDVDCGGACDKCGAGKHCNMGTDCGSGTCTADLCQ